MSNGGNRIFNVAGPCIPGEHYMLDPLRGIGDELTRLVDTKQYFVIHAARQCGKTTLLKQLTRSINARGERYALYCSLEAVDGWTEPEKGVPAVIQQIELNIRNHGLPAGFAKDIDYSKTTVVLNEALTDYCRALDKPLIIFFDEADCLSDMTLITFLRQLRNGYVNRGDVPFVHSVALVGMRNLRDYKVKARGDSATLGSVSPFNIVKEALSLRNFTKQDVAELYAQHTAETGQVFERQAIDYAFEQTQGQPWLVNAIACECVEKVAKLDYTIPITRDMAELAVQNIVLAHGTHFDSMVERLKEERVRNVVGPLIIGEEVANRRGEDYLYTRDLGIIRERDGKVEPANPIYAELIIRALNWDVQETIKSEHEEYVIPRYLKDGKIDMAFLMKDFQQYWRENSEIWDDRYKKHYYEYDEYATHLVMQAFLQRVINGGGQVIREMAFGKKRADLCVVYNGQKYPIELKILQNMRGNAKGIEQLLGYMDRIGSNTGWLVIFDKDTKKSWDEKIYLREETVGEKTVTVIGC